VARLALSSRRPLAAAAAREARERARRGLMNVLISPVPMALALG
jgi:hypothetical protein